MDNVKQRKIITNWAWLSEDDFLQNNLETLLIDTLASLKAGRISLKEISALKITLDAYLIKAKAYDAEEDTRDKLLEELQGKILEVFKDDDEEQQ